MSHPQFHIYTANRMESLAERWLAVSCAPLSHPFAKECVVVQNQGMARWLSFRMAEKAGICMNLDFPYPRRFMNETLARVFPEFDAAAEWNRENMLWTLYRCLPDFINREGDRLAEIRHYFSDGSLRKRFQISGQIADVFDRYAIYRPELLARWASQPDTAVWLSAVWNLLVKELGNPSLLYTWINALPGALARTEAVLPERLSIIGISSLPPLFLRFFEALSEKIPVHLFFLSPVGEDIFWSDLQTKRQHARRLLKADAAAGSPDAFSGNPVLAATGRQGQDFFNLLLDLDNKWEHALFTPPDEGSMLGQLQSDLFHMRDRGVADAEKWTAEPNDGSLQVHACHSPMREVEVLYDNLLRYFEEDSGLSPEEVLVTIPDIDVYAPYIHAVFSSPENERKRIPYTIADRKLSSESPVTDALFALFELSRSRLGQTEVLDFLFRECVRRRFGFSAADFERIKQLVEQSGIRWGADAKHRAELGVADFEQNSWRWGLKRLVLGFVMDGGDRQLYADILPENALAVGGELLGRFVKAVETVLGLVARFRKPMPLVAWSATLTAALEHCFAEGDAAAGESRKVRALFSELLKQEACAKDVPVDADSMLDFLRQRMIESENAAAFMRGGITFCSMKPMRAVPAEIICVLGLNYDAFPRASHALSFDETSRKPRVGDRSQRENDHYLFLETILSARKSLYLSYVGRSETDNSLLPPSVLLTELEDYLTVAWEGAAKPWRFEHRLQPFNKVYFEEGSRMQSYSADNAEACVSLANEPLAGSDTFSGVFPLSGEEWEQIRQVNTKDLIAGLRNPTRIFLKKRLGLMLPPDKTPVSDEEPFEPDSLERYALKHHLVSSALSGTEPDTQAFLQAGGRIAPGEAGSYFFEQTQAEAEKLAARIRDESGGSPMRTLAYGGELAGCRVSGEAALCGEQLLFWHASRQSPKHLLEAWIHLLAVACFSEVKVTSAKIINAAGGTPGAEILNVPEAPEAILGALLGIYRSAFEQRIPLFEKASPAFVKDAAKGRENGVRSAEQDFAGNRYGSGDCADPYVAYAYRDAFDFRSDAFQTLATAVYGELFAACGKTAKRKTGKPQAES